MSETKKRIKFDGRRDVSQHHNKTDAIEFQSENTQNGLFKKILIKFQGGDQKLKEAQKQSELIDKIYKNAKEPYPDSKIMKIGKTDELGRKESSDMKELLEEGNDFKEEISRDFFCKRYKYFENEKKLKDHKNVIEEPREEKRADKKDKLTSKSNIENNKSEKNKINNWSEESGSKESSSISDEIKRVEPLKENIIEKQDQEDLRKGLKGGLEKEISRDMGEGGFKNLEIPKDFFYIVGQKFHCKDVESLKKLYDKLKSFPKVELYLKNQDCKNVPSNYTIRRLVQESLNSKLEYNILRHDFRLRKVQEIAKERGGECLSTEYRGSLTKLKFRCKNGHEFEATPNGVKDKDSWCPKCGGVKKLTLKEFQDIAKERDGECLSTEYKNSYTKLKFRCKNGHEFEAIPSAVKSGHSWCPTCGGVKKLTLKEFQDIAKERDGECLSSEYKNNYTKLKFRCKNGHEFEAKPNDVKNKDSWCPACYGNKRLTLKEFQDIAKERGGECLSSEYKDSRSKLKFRCKNGHKFEATPNDVKNLDSWCPICSERAGERICRGLFEAIFNKDFKKVRLEWLKNSEGRQLELDGYNDELKLAFERQGIQHYKFPNYFHKTIRQFISQLSNDHQKGELGEMHGVTLIEIPYWIKYDEMHDYILRQCEVRGVMVPEIKFKIDWKKFKWDTDDDNNRSLEEWM